MTCFDVIKINALKQTMENELSSADLMGRNSVVSSSQDATDFGIPPEMGTAMEKALSEKEEAQEVCKN